MSETPNQLVQRARMDWIDKEQKRADLEEAQVLRRRNEVKRDELWYELKKLNLIQSGLESLIEQLQKEVMK